ncbi:MAG: response regulator, partial [Halobacteriales archaeon]|nr:response regulator [Halobacteriales archaeon]
MVSRERDGLQLLLVDDDDEQLGLAAERLTAALDGADIRTATDPTAALEIVTSESIDCVVSDYRMPDQDGLSLLRDIRAETPNVPFILFTGQGSEEVASEAIAAGVTDYVQKGGPEVYELLANRIENALDRHQHRRKIKALHEVAHDLESLDSTMEVYERTVMAARTLLEFETGNVSVYDPDAEMFETVVAEDTVFDLPHRFAAKGSLAGRTLREETTVVVDDTERCEEILSEYARQSALSVPISDRAVLQAGSDTTNAFDENDVELAELLATHAGQAIDRIDRRSALKRERDRFEVLFETLPEPTVHLRNDAAIISDINPAFEEVFGYSIEEARGESINDLIVPEDRLQEAQRIDNRADDELFTKEVQRQTKDGELRDFLLIATGRVIDEAADRPEGYAIYADITERKSYERRLQRQNERLEQVADLVAHDIRTPLNTALGNLELYDETGERDRLDRVEHALTRIDDIVADIRTLAKQGEAVLEPHPVNLKWACQEAWQTIQTAEATLELPDADLTVSADDSRLIQLLENLLRNAIDHGGPAVTVRVSRLADPTGFYIADDGPGIPPEDRSIVFESGYTTADSGTGFGLAIVEQIAAAHGWSISITSSQDGGARIEI